MSETLEANRLAEMETQATVGAPPVEAQARPYGRFQIPGDVIARACESLTDEQRSAVKWAAAHCRARNISCSDFGALLRQPGSGEPYSGDSIYQVLTGRRTISSVDRFAEAVGDLRRRIEETLPRATSTFVETSLTRAISATCARALARQRITFIFGPSQIGKTTALAEFTGAAPHGDVVLLRMPTRGGLVDFLDETALRVGVSAHAKARELRRRIIESFDSRMLLIVDECHQCLTGHYSDRALASLEFIREIWDRRKCGVVLCGTNIFADGLRSNRVLRQLWLRGYRPLQLPAQPSREDLDRFAAAFGLEPAPAKVRTLEVHDDGGAVQRITAAPAGVQEGTIRADGLGRWMSILEDAADLARERSTKVTWSHVLIAWNLSERKEAI